MSSGRRHDQRERGQAETARDPARAVTLPERAQRRPRDDGHQHGKDGCLSKYVHDPLSNASLLGVDLTRTRGRWLRNKRLRCDCGGYWFPHRRGGGSCDTSPRVWYWRARWQGASETEAQLEQAFHGAGVTSFEPPF